MTGCYENLIGGFASEANVDFTGGIAEHYNLSEAPPNLFNIMEKALSRGSLLSTHISVCTLAAYYPKRLRITFITEVQTGIILYLINLFKFFWFIYRPAMTEKKNRLKMIWWKHMPTPSWQPRRSDTEKTHTSIYFLAHLSYIGSWGTSSLSQGPWATRRRTLWTGCQPLTGHDHTHTHKRYQSVYTTETYMHTYCNLHSLDYIQGTPIKDILY